MGEVAGREEKGDAVVRAFTARDVVGPAQACASLPPQKAVQAEGTPCYPPQETVRPVRIAAAHLPGGTAQRGGPRDGVGYITRGTGPAKMRVQAAVAAPWWAIKGGKGCPPGANRQRLVWNVVREHKEHLHPLDKVGGAAEAVAAVEGHFFL